ncbi:NGG1p interacting factor 3 [Paxillus ammoniavirescens]|nr:NGG1p interacting factor 3 [Paxillus ammoniavirescens]
MSLVTRYAQKAMEKIAPLRLAEKWDNVGLLLETPVPRPNATRVLLTIDLTPSVLEEALEPSIALVVSYHPTIFKPLSSLTLSKPLQASLLKLAAAGVSVYSPHTALDSVHGGINDWLAQCAGVPENSTISDHSFDVSLLGEPKGDEGGVGRLLSLQDPVSIEELVGRIKKHLHVQYVDVGRPVLPRRVSTIAICAGSGGSVLGGFDADVYFTGEMAHHEVQAAVAAGRYVVLCGHTNTERGYLPLLASKLSSAFAAFASEDESQEGSESLASLSTISGSSVALTKKEKETLKNVQVFVSTADRHPLERM